MTQWKEERIAQCPAELQLVAPNLYIQRRNVRKERHEERDGIEAYTDYVCESREISVSEYEMIKSIEAIREQRAIDEYTLQLMEQEVI